MNNTIVYGIQYIMTNSMSYLVLLALCFRTPLQSPLSPSKDNTLRLHEGFHPTMTQVTYVACTQDDPIFSLGRPNFESLNFQASSHLSSSMCCTSSPIFTQPSTPLHHFKIYCIGLLWAINTLPSTRTMIPNFSLRNILLIEVFLPPKSTPIHFSHGL